jgi:hypothetical protein
MIAADLIEYLSGHLPATELQAKVEPEVLMWAKQLSERGRSASVVLHGMDNFFDVTLEHALRLLDALISRDLMPATFAYVLDALLLDEKFRWAREDVRDAMEHVLGSQYPKQLDLRRAWKVRAELKALGLG